MGTRLVRRFGGEAQGIEQVIEDIRDHKEQS